MAAGGGEVGDMRAGGVGPGGEVGGMGGEVGPGDTSIGSSVLECQKNSYS